MDRPIDYANRIYNNSVAHSSASVVETSFHFSDFHHRVRLRYCRIRRRQPLQVHNKETEEDGGDELEDGELEVSGEEFVVFPQQELQVPTK